MQCLQNAAAGGGSNPHLSAESSSSSSAGGEAGGTHETVGSAQEAVGTTSRTHVMPAASGDDGADSCVLPAAAGAAVVGASSSIGLGFSQEQQEALQAHLRTLQLTEQASIAVDAAPCHPSDSAAAAQSMHADGSTPAAAATVRLDPAAATQRLAAWSTSAGATSSSTATVAAAGPAGQVLVTLPEAAPYAAGSQVAAGLQAEQGAAAVVSILAAEADYKDCSR
jgi:hypothetical protein